MSDKPQPKNIKELFDAAAPAPTTEAMVVAFMRFAGGPEKFAKMLYDEFVSAPRGGMVRQQILSAIMRGMQGIDRDKNPLHNLGDLSIDDLQRLVDQKSAALGLKGAGDAAK